MKDLVLRVLGSIGRPAEASFYLSEYSARRKEQFAAIWVDDAVGCDEAHAYAVAVDLQLLHQLGLTPVLAFASAECAQAIAAAVDGDVPTRLADPADAVAVVRAGAIPLVAVASDAELGAMCSALDSQKLVLLGTRRGLERNTGETLSLIDPVADRAAIDGALAPDQAALLARATALLGSVDHKMTVAITSPLNLLQELFTVRGAGTLIRIGAPVAVHDSYAGIDQERLAQVIESAFGRPPSAALWSRPVSRIYIADDYLGAAIVAPTPLAPYLSKLAVGLVARGEGIGRDLWRAVARDHARLFWRARRNNPIASWYREHCDGMVRRASGLSPQSSGSDALIWEVYWRGLLPEEIARAIELAAAAPVDFPD